MTEERGVNIQCIFNSFQMRVNLWLCPPQLQLFQEQQRPANLVDRKTSKHQRNKMLTTILQRMAIKPVVQDQQRREKG
jgi:hypothetical protein